MNKQLPWVNKLDRRNVLRKQKKSNFNELAVENITREGSSIQMRAPCVLARVRACRRSAHAQACITDARGQAKREASRQRDCERMKG